MSKLAGYARTLRAYLATANGAHAARDYGRALVLIALTVAIGLALLAVT